MKLGSFLAGTMKGAEEKKKKIPAVPETLKKKRKNFAELKIKSLRKKFKFPCRGFMHAHRSYHKMKGCLSPL